ncbi:26.5 kDa heat shock protein, mitochondrial [Ananas comosus]|uniref:26.5 kDa heat shock protein, mitochondrial n=2 Tax=Ananas comosus TaxID=4615 RepID=A0A6P5EWU6_ANACO|nr:26.5 kDa heat shock protein, mitochondrial [Ananas comosus]
MEDSWNCSSSSFSSGAATQADDAASKVPAAAEKREVATSSRRGRRGRLWRSPWDLVPFRLNTDGLGNALMRVSENLNRVLENWMPSRLLGRMKEDDSCYKLRFEVPGLSKDDIRITVEDGMLVVTGERKEEEALDEDEDQGGWYSQRYGFYNTSLLLPDDAEVAHIKAEVKNGVLYVTIPRSAERRRNVTEVKIQ